MTMHAISDNVIYSQGNIQVSLTSMTVSLSGGGFLLRHRLERVQVTLRRKFTCRNYPRKQNIVTQPAVNPHLVVTFLVGTYLIISYLIHLQLVFFLSVEGEGLWRLHELEKKVVRKVDLLRSTVFSFLFFIVVPKKLMFHDKSFVVFLCIPHPRLWITALANAH